MFRPLQIAACLLIAIASLFPVTAAARREGRGGKVAVGRGFDPAKKVRLRQILPRAPPPPPLALPQPRPENQRRKKGLYARRVRPRHRKRLRDRLHPPPQRRTVLPL